MVFDPDLQAIIDADGLDRLNVETTTDLDLLGILTQGKVRKYQQDEERETDGYYVSHGETSNRDISDRLPTPND